jgi:glucuronokinase
MTLLLCLMGVVESRLCEQDRVVQVYEGLVYMNLSTELLKSRGFGEYENVDIPLQELPQFFLVYLADPSDSGKIHNDVKMRWINGEQQVVDAMNQVRLS